MGIIIGQRLGSFEVLSLLGRGGQGEVYRVRDTQLQRDVALKLLPDALASDPERLARFQREAQVLASLNHPNIAHIYGLEKAGSSGCIVMELVHGETLQERLKRGAIPMDEALAIAKQVAEALEAAHDKDIIHRDLKPANVKITPEGRVKVLDFGLAKALDTGPAHADLSNSPTLMSMAATNSGMILGTAAYMSPEQAKGLAVDRRTDIFSFGAMLYEMLTGRQAFQGDNLSEILARVIEREPEWSHVPAATPAGIRRLLRRCLHKDRRRRTQTAIDILIELEEAKIEPETSVQSVTTIAPSHRFRRIFTAFFVLATIALAVPAIMHFREDSTAPPQTRLEINTPSTADPLSFAISPDGRRLVFVASGNGPSRLWLRPLDETSAQPLAGTEAASYPFWSPDSRSVGFFAGGKLKRVDIGGGLPQTLANAILGYGGTWNADGVILFSTAPSNVILRVVASGGGRL